MTFEFHLPDIGEGITEGEILKWMAKEGDTIKEDQPLVEIMTDKVNVQIPSPRSGKVIQILAKEGDMAKVGQTIMVIDDGSGGGATVQSAPAPAQTARVAPSPPPAQPVPPQGVLATPATRRLARELGVDISAVRGSGPQGRVTDDDVKRFVSGSRSGPATVTVAAPRPAAAGGKEELVPLRGVRKTISERMLKSLQTTAQVTHVDEADMTDLVLLREAFKGSAEKRGSASPTCLSSSRRSSPP